MTAATDFYALLGLERKYKLDMAELRRRFYAQSATHHPDRAATGDATTQAEALDKTAQLNEALRVLSHPMRRLEHLLFVEEKPLPENAALSPQFMMEMMELNELAEEDAEAAQKQITALQEDWQQNLNALTARYDAGERSEALFRDLQDAYFRQKYLERVQVS